VPTYEYVCKKCDHQFDAVQSFSEDALTVCPKCGGPLNKKFGSVGVVFKGSGFYRTDSREEKRASKAEAKADGGHSGDGGKTGDGAKSNDGAKADGGQSGDSGGKSADAASGKPEKKSPDTKSTQPSKAPRPAVEKSSKKS
jgi:putative FmdB family regulatory protein